MSDEKRLISLIAKPSDSPEVSAWMAELKAPEPRLKKGETRAHVTLPKLGIELVFKDEAFHTKRSDLAIGEGALLLTAIMFKFKTPDFDDYTGPLPMGVAWGDTPDQVHAKLGSAGKAHAVLPKESWTLDAAKLFVTYNEAKTGVEGITLQMP